MKLQEFVLDMDHVSDSAWAFRNFRQTVLSLARACDARAVLEIGGGARPLLTHEEAAEHGFSYSVNDIRQEELDKAPGYVGTRCFDIAGDIPAEDRGQYDFVFSKMVLEHVRDGERAHRNIYALLREGGVAFCFFPTLYSPPFVLNKLAPLSIAAWVRDRCGSRHHGHKGFPARYSLCYATGRLRRILAEIGFSEIEVIPFYGYDYFESIRIVGATANAISQTAKRKNWRALASYAYCIAAK